MWVDPIVEEVRRAREEHAARFNFDLAAIFQDFKEQEKRSGRKTVSLSPKRPAASGTPAGDAGKVP